MTPEETRRIFDAWERRMMLEWLGAMAAVKGDLTITEVTALLESGNTAEALRYIDRAVTGWFNRAWVPAFNESASAAALFLQEATGVPIVLDQITNMKAVNAIQANGLRLVRGFSTQQTEAAMQAIQRSFTTGANPIATARAFRDSIGLTARQEQAVQNYRIALEERPRASLGRALRDRRFDSTVRRAAESGEALPADKIDRMVGRYRERMLRYRSETIARTESLRSVHQGQFRMYEQAIDEGRIQPQQMEREWNTAVDERVRESHSMMHGQKTTMDEPFISGLGNALMYPGDPGAPAEDTVQCRCAVGTRIKEIVVPAEFSV